MSSTLASGSFNGYGENCNGASVGTITTTPAGGSGTYTYAWTSTPAGFSSASQNLSGLTARTYNLTVTDSKGCTATNSIVITQPSVITFTTQVSFACSGGVYTTGNITVDASGGASGSYEYSKDGGSSWQSSNVFPGLSPGTYNIKVRDASTTSCVSATTPTAVTLPSSSGSTSDCNYIYVTTGGDPGNPGSKGCPTDLIHALSLASSTNNHILVGIGNYTYTSTISIPAVSGLVIDGGYDANWIKISDQGATTVAINPPLANDGTAGYYMGIQPASGANGFTIKDITFNVKTGGASGQFNSRGISIYGLYIVGQTGFNISRCVINTGAASPEQQELRVLQVQAVQAAAAETAVAVQAAVAVVVRVVQDYPVTAEQQAAAAAAASVRAVIL